VLISSVKSRFVMQYCILLGQFTNDDELFSSRYVITSRCLGAGGFGKVMVGIHQKTQRQVACKIIDLRNMWSKLPASNLELPTKDYGQTQEDDTTTAKNRWPGKVARCFREFDILKDLSHV
jgi:serine/threonine protein kinase